MKKNIIVTAILYTFFFSVSTAQNFLHNFEDATTQAQSESKTVMMIFSGSDWCKPCIQLRKTILEDPVFDEYANDKLVLLELDFPYKKKNRLPKEQQKHNEKLADQYNPQGIFPLMLLLDANGEVIQKMEFDPRLTPASYVTKIKRQVAKS